MTIILIPLAMLRKGGNLCYESFKYTSGGGSAGADLHGNICVPADVFQEAC